MSAAATLALAQALLAGLKTLIPTIREFTSGGEITAEQEQALLNDIGSLRGQPGSTYAGPEWEPSGRTAQQPPVPGQQPQPQAQQPKQPLPTAAPRQPGLPGRR